MATQQRPFNPKALKRRATSEIQPALGPEALVRRFTVFVPVEQIEAGQPARRVATDDDLKQIQLLLVKDFGGVTMSTMSPSLVGWGARDPRRPKKTQELNRHAFFTVYAAAVRASDDYFLALQKELAEALVEGVILVERQDVTIL
jgi:hypothetical protein